MCDPRYAKSHPAEFQSYDAMLVLPIRAISGPESLFRV
jgi:hypothetical protein